MMFEAKILEMIFARPTHSLCSVQYHYTDFVRHLIDFPGQVNGGEDIGSPRRSDIFPAGSYSCDNWKRSPLSGSLLAAPLGCSTLSKMDCLTLRSNHQRSLKQLEPLQLQREH